MAEVKTWTVEQIEAAACTASDHEYKPFSWRHDLCETCGCSKDRHEWGAMLRAFAAQTRQVEQMREWAAQNHDEHHTVINGFDTTFCDADCPMCKVLAFFPKDGAQ